MASNPTLRDRAMQALDLLALDPIAEVQAAANSYGFRKDRSTADAIARCYQVLARKSAATWVLEGDIQSCYDQISHAWLLAHIPMDKAMLHKWLKAGYREQQRFFPTDEGVPQGGIISPVLANMTLAGLEQCLREAFPRRSPSQPLVNFARYADDFVVTGHTQALLENKVRPVIETFLHERGLVLAREKTKITPIAEGFDFLGQNIRKYKRQLL